MDDREFLGQFEQLTLPFDQWTHRAHVKVAYLYATTHPFDESIDRMRAGIKAYNAANNVPEGPLTGYNETTTVAFMRIVHATISAYGKTFPVSTADEFCDTHPHLLNRTVLRLFYSPDLRVSPDAKTSYVEPDLAPLPRILVVESHSRP